MIKYYLILAALLVPCTASAVTITLDGGRVITSDKVVRISGEITQDSGHKFSDDMAATANLPGPRIVLIDSNGGRVDVGDEMVDMIHGEQARGVEVVCFVRNQAHSMAFNFLTNCNLRLAGHRALMLVHKVRQDLSERPYTSLQLRRIANELDLDDEPFRQANSKAMRLSLSDYDTYADKETMWSAQTLKNRGYLHDFATVTK